MANDRTIEGYEVRQSTALPARVGDLEIQLVADYRGANLAGKVIRITNRRRKSITLAERDLAPRDTLAVSIVNPALDPGSSTTAFVVGANGESSHD
jgi:conjugal transfer pilus assembly protein TraK